MINNDGYYEHSDIISGNSSNYYSYKSNESKGRNASDIIIRSRLFPYFASRISSLEEEGIPIFLINYLKEKMIEDNKKEVIKNPSNETAINFLEKLMNVNVTNLEILRVYEEMFEINPHSEDINFIEVSDHPLMNIKMRYSDKLLNGGDTKI